MTWKLSLESKFILTQFANERNPYFIKILIKHLFTCVPPLSLPLPPPLRSTFCKNVHRRWLQMHIKKEKATFLKLEIFPRRLMRWSFRLHLRRALTEFVKQSVHSRRQINKRLFQFANKKVEIFLFFQVGKEGGDLLLEDNLKIFVCFRCILYYLQTGRVFQTFYSFFFFCNWWMVVQSRRRNFLKIRKVGRGIRG